MKILAFNGSPKMDKGNTALILNPFIQGIREAGADVDLFYTNLLDIRPCRGELSCWQQNPRKCFQDDDMQQIYAKSDADMLVFASPVYVWGMSGPLKNLLDRTINVMPIQARRVVLVSSCGFWGMDNFEPLLAQMKMMCRYTGWEFAGALLRPHAAALKMMLEMGKPVADIAEAATLAGIQLVKDGGFSRETLDIVSRELVPLDVWEQRIKSTFQAGSAG